MKYTTILFDLDGTITDSAQGILNSVKYSLEKMALQIPETEELYSFIGPPLKDSFMEKDQLSSVEADQAVVYYREYFAEAGLYENDVYEGIPELLTTLKAAGCTLYIATSKPEVFAKKIVKHFNLDPFFEGIYGASMDGRRSKKGDVIRYAMEQAEISEAATVMIGDREHDVTGAKENGLPCVGVLYGYGSREELLSAGVWQLASSPEYIYTALCE